MKNILFILSDQQRADTLGCYGQKLPVSPNIDQLAREGVKFEYAFTPQPVCGPARACLQTGMYATQLGCYINGRGLDPAQDTMAKQLKKAGYETAYVGKWHLAINRPQGLVYATQPAPPERCGGYDDYLAMCDTLETTSHGYNGYVFDKDGNKMEFIGYRPDCLTDYAIDYIHNKDNDKPFLLFVSYLEPHQQNDHGCFEGPDGSKERFKDYTVPQDLLNGKYEGDWKQNYPDYLGACNSLDYNVGRLVDTLKEKGIYEDTIIIYTSDHGCHFRTQEGEYKRQCFDSCLRVPLIISGGEFCGGRTYTELVSLINLAPTVLECAGVAAPDYMAEPSLQHLLHDDVEWDNCVVYQISETELARGIRTKRYKYCVHAPHVQELLRMDLKYSVEQYQAMLKKSRFSSDSYVDQYLFDLVKDPHEKHNLVNDPAYEEVLVQLRQLLKAKMAHAGEAEPVIYPADHQF